MKTALFPVIALVAALGGCATMQNTAAQDRVENAWRQCQLEGRVAGNVRLVRIEANGRYWLSSSDSGYGFTDTKACIAEKARAGR